LGLLLLRKSTPISRNNPVSLTPIRVELRSLEDCHWLQAIAHAFPFRVICVPCLLAETVAAIFEEEVSDRCSDSTVGMAWAWLGWGAIHPKVVLASRVEARQRRNQKPKGDPEGPQVRKK
jgi:hypothetical protein